MNRARPKIYVQYLDKASVTEGNRKREPAASNLRSVAALTCIVSFVEAIWVRRLLTHVPAP